MALKRASVRRPRVALLLGIALCGLTAARAACAEDIRVLSAGAVQPVMKLLLEDFQSGTGHRVHVSYGPIGATKARLLGGEGADAVILTPAALQELADQGWIRAASRTDLWRVGVGVAVRAGDPQPAIASPQAFKDALEASPAIYHSDPALTSSGAYLKSLFERLGITDAVKGNAHVFLRSEDALEALEHGRTAGIALAPVTEILADKNVALVGPLPAELQNLTTYAGAVPSRAQHPEAAEALLRFLGRAEHRARYEAIGFQPPR